MITQIRSSRTLARVRRHEILAQFIKYALVGVLNVAMFFAIFNALLFARVPEIPANAIAFLTSSVNSYFLNKRWTFRDPRQTARVRQYLVFVSFTLIGLGINTGVFSLLLIPLRQYGTIGTNIAALGGLPLTVIWNFTSYRLWTFETGRRPSVKGAGSTSPSSAEA